MLGNRGHVGTKRGGMLLDRVVGLCLVRKGGGGTRNSVDGWQPAGLIIQQVSSCTDGRAWMHTQHLTHLMAATGATRHLTVLTA